MNAGWIGLLCMAAALSAPTAQAARVSDVRASLHNLSAAPAGTPTSDGRTVPSRTVQASSESQVCVFCHTPHGATQQDASSTAVRAPLWNRSIPSGSTYTRYTSNSLDANYIAGAIADQPGGSSKLCLSCHDGTLAIGQVNVLEGAAPATIAMTGTAGGGVIASGSGTTTGFTRNLGQDLRNDHPISVTYSSTLANRDGELRVPDANQKWPQGSSGAAVTVGKRNATDRPSLPLEATGSGATDGQVQCATCHDPHIVETDTSKGNQKFLRQNRFQEAQPTGVFSDANDIICLSCHDKGGTSWAYSVHAHQGAADETYKNSGTPNPTALREFPANLPVWKASCLNCHDTHAVAGTRRLLREGTEDSGNPKTGSSGRAAIEETCYQCHRLRTDAAQVLDLATQTVPNIRTDFTATGNKRMPITSDAQDTSGTAATAERHDIGGNFNDSGFVDCTGASNECGADMIESRALLGQTAGNRHAECTDCHNPHRVIKNPNGLPGALTAGNTNSASGATHDHASGHTNLISGALRGTWGVEPSYGAAPSFYTLPIGYTVKRGDPGTSSSTLVTQPYVTREYQICLKCHSDYAYNDANLTAANYNSTSLRTPLGGTNLTAANTEGRTNYSRYTNQAREFAPVNAAGATGAHSAFLTGTAGANNHRSWHPVIGPTNRTTAVRAISGGSGWQAPWDTDAQVGVQTMYCSDCHGSSVSGSGSVVPDSGGVWGPHGSANNFILKGPYGNSNAASLLCVKCHDDGVYRTGTVEGDAKCDGNNTPSGFCSADANKGNLHAYHQKRVGNLKCVWCHTAVPHGWKNKALLVNLNDVGPEAGQAAGTRVNIDADGDYYSNGPYYVRAKLKVINFRASGQWRVGDCGNSAASGGALINSTNGASNNDAQTGIDWMKETCANPP